MIMVPRTGRTTMHGTDFRMGQIVACEVAPGDILLDVPHDNQGIRKDLARVLGTVLRVERMGEGLNQAFIYTIQTDSGSVREWPEEPVGCFVNTWVHVPWTTRITAEGEDD